MSAEHICALVTDFAAQNNKDAPRLLSETARLDHVDLSCEARTLVFNKTMLVPEAGLPAGWRDAYQADRDLVVCRNRNLSQMVLAGWRISENITFPDGSRTELVAGCAVAPLPLLPTPAPPGH